MIIAPVFVGGRDNEVIFTSTRDATTGSKRKSAITGTRFADLFTSKFEVQKQKWEAPKLLDENLSINTASDEGAATLSSRGDLMIFTRARYDKSKDMGSELLVANQSRGAWSEPTKLELVGDSIIAAHPSLSADGTELYFVSDRPGGYGGKDIWMAKGKGNAFDKPVNLGPRNQYSGRRNVSVYPAKMEICIFRPIIIPELVDSTFLKQSWAKIKSGMLKT